MILSFSKYETNVHLIFGQGNHQENLSIIAARHLL